MTLLHLSIWGSFFVYSPASASVHCFYYASIRCLRATCFPSSVPIVSVYDLLFRIWNIACFCLCFDTFSLHVRGQGTCNIRLLRLFRAFSRLSSQFLYGCWQYLALFLCTQALSPRIRFWKVHFHVSRCYQKILIASDTFSSVLRLSNKLLFTDIFILVCATFRSLWITHFM